MSVYTVFAYGTGESEKETNNIISQFRQSCSSEHFYIDGPKTLGKEVIPNAKNATKKIIDWLKLQEGDDNKINLTGFSRGSVTCIHIANNLKNVEKGLERKKYHLERNGRQLNDADQKLLNQLKKMDLNMFLMDPVAGLMDKKIKNGRVIPDNVRNYVAVLQQDERRRDFKPQDITRAIIVSPEKTKVTMLPMYGNHSDTTKIKNSGMQSGPQIAWHSLHRFLTQHGTEFKQDGQDIIPQITSSNLERSTLPPISNSKELLKLFSVNHQERENYRQSGLLSKLTDGIPAPRVERTLNDHLKYYVKNPGFFVNQLERELFKISYPKSFNYLFEKNLPDPRFPEASSSLPDDVISELAILKRENPALFQDLRALGVKSNGEQISLGKPRGYHYLEPCTSMQQIYPDLVPESVKNHALEMDKLPALEMEIYRLAFNYQRDKLSVDFFGGRSQTSRAIQLCDDINYIVNKEEVSREEKYGLLLDKLEENYKEMLLSDNCSQLSDMIQTTLANHGRQYKINEAGVLNSLLVNFSYSFFALVQKTISFVGNLGYIGGGTLYSLGNALQSIGRRSQELLGEIDNPLKVIGLIAASLVEATGFMIKNSFGLKPLTSFVTQGIGMMRDAFIQLINTTKIERIVDEKLQQQDNVEPLNDVPHSPPEQAEEIPLVAKEVTTHTLSDFKHQLCELRNKEKTRQPEVIPEDMPEPHMP